MLPLGGGLVPFLLVAVFAPGVAVKVPGLVADLPSLAPVEGGGLLEADALLGGVEGHPPHLEAVDGLLEGRAPGAVLAFAGVALKKAAPGGPSAVAGDPEAAHPVAVLLLVHVVEEGPPEILLLALVLLGVVAEEEGHEAVHVAAGDDHGHVCFCPVRHGLPPLSPSAAACEEAGPVDVGVDEVGVVADRLAPRAFVVIDFPREIRLECLEGPVVVLEDVRVEVVDV